MATSATSTTTPSFRKISRTKLGISEPNPRMFGNQANDASNPSWTNPNWLKSRFHFSFAEYYNPANTNFGVLRVLNDDLVQPSRGFATHGHANAEICTYVIAGSLTHADSMGTSETLSRGAIQFMTAGSGVRHSEANNSPTQPLRFIQMWLSPRSKGLLPNYGSSQGDQEKRTNQWHHMVSDVDNAQLADGAATTVQINTDANMFATELEPSKTLDFYVKEGRQAYVLCVDGETRVLDRKNSAGETGENADLAVCLEETATVLERHDAAELIGPITITFVTNELTATHLLVVEMKYDARNSGRGDL